MSTGLKFVKFVGVVVLCAVVFGMSSASAASSHSQRKAKKPPLPPLPSGPTGPVQQIPLDSIPPQPPQVSFQNGQLTIVAPNSTLADILRAIRKQTGAEIEIPAATDRVVTHLGPGPAREVLAELLNGSRFNYVLLGSPEDASLLTRVVLVTKTAGADMNANSQPPQQQEPVAMQTGIQPGNTVQQQEAPPDISDADTVEDTTDDTADQAAEADQPVATPDQSGVKTPQQMLQEMQQRQLQLQQQQQQQPGQPHIPGGRPPQEQQ